MPPRYYLDEDVSHRIAPLVRAAGYDVLTTRDADRNGTPGCYSFPDRCKTMISPTWRLLLSPTRTCMQTAFHQA